MNKTVLVGIGIAIIAVAVFATSFDYDLEPAPPVTQHDLRVMIDEWMNNPQEDDMEQRFEIMKAYYTLQESGQKLTDDQEGRVMYNQIVKMVSFDIPKVELDAMKQEIRDELQELGILIQQEEPTDISSSECLGTARCITGTVTSIIDGDTIKVDGQSVRFALVDAPELKYDGGQSGKFIEEICPVGSTVVVDQDDDQLQDKYGRLLGVIYCNDLNLNKEVLDSGIGDLYSAFCDQSEFKESDWAIKHGC
ncbi:thermonuclease family protein [Nitrosopumilus sp.]|uniref:thermonuclease family protein n=1 Tax=Nitrosopumilus sp. TaxID=2024843 RepID=UPI003D11BF51